VKKRIQVTISVSSNNFICRAVISANENY